MPIDPVSMGIAAGVNVAAPMIAKGIGSLFGLDEASSEERRAAQRRQEAIDRLTAAAEGRTASPAQLQALAQQQRTQQALASFAQRGNVQQRAGNVRAAMQAAPEIMAQQGAQMAATRAAEMESARNALAQAQLGVATQEAAQGAANRQYMQRLIGAGVQGAATAATMGLQAEKPEKPDGMENDDADEVLELQDQYRQPSLQFGPEASEALRSAGVVQSGAPQLGGASGYGRRRRGASPYGMPSLPGMNLTLGGR